jgi:hypothetical protein
VERVRASKSSSEGFAYVGKAETKFTLINVWEVWALQGTRNIQGVPKRVGWYQRKPNKFISNRNKGIGF